MLLVFFWLAGEFSGANRAASLTHYAAAMPARSRGARRPWYLLMQYRAGPDLIFPLITNGDTLFTRFTRKHFYRGVIFTLRMPLYASSQYSKAKINDIEDIYLLLAFRGAWSLQNCKHTTQFISPPGQYFCFLKANAKIRAADIWSRHMMTALLGMITAANAMLHIAIRLTPPSITVEIT